MFDPMLMLNELVMCGEVKMILVFWRRGKEGRMEGDVRREGRKVRVRY
jgi:hypothetical protein